MIFTDEREAKIAQGLLLTLRARSPAKVKLFELWVEALPEVIRLLGPEDKKPRNARYTGITEEITRAGYVKSNVSPPWTDVNVGLELSEDGIRFVDDNYVKV